jgi:hypothetical protein
VRDVMPPVYFATFFLLLFPLILFGFGAVLNSKSADLQGDFRYVFIVFTLSLFSVSDLLQSASIGALIGMIVPITINQTSSAYAITILLYLLSQALLYLVSLTTWIIIWPELGISQGMRWYLIGLFTIVTYRELYLRFLWQLFTWRLEADFGELDAIVHINALGRVWRSQ